MIVNIRTGYVFGSIGVAAALVAWVMYTRTLPAEKRAAWWCHAVTAVLAASLIGMVVKSASPAQAAQLPAHDEDAALYALPRAQQAPRALPPAEAHPHPVNTLDDFERGTPRPDMHVKLAPEGIYLYQSGNWVPTRLSELELLSNATVMVEDAGSRERVRTGVFSTLQRGNNTIIMES